MVSAFPLWCAGQLEVWLWWSWLMGPSLTSSRRWSHGFKWWGCFFFLECGLSGVCPRGGMPAQGDCGWAKRPLSQPLHPAWPLSLGLCPPEQVKGNVRPRSRADPSGGQSAWWPWPWCGGPADRGGCGGEGGLTMPRHGDAGGSGAAPNSDVPDHRVVVGPGQG